MHARQAFAWIAREYVRHPAHGDNELIARELIRRDVHFVRADFRIAYAVSFLTDESVIASPPARARRTRGALSRHAS
ncbi:MAG TPA: hypothetical protein VFN67_40260 [Polyangiales bacterium]|nr:hypothetical protein [Polyangiales bacterium]